MHDFLKSIKVVLAGFIVLLLSSSCLDKEIDGYQEEAQQKMTAFLSANGYTEAENIGYGIYVKVTEESDDTISPIIGNTVLMNYTGMYTDNANTVFETTDKAIAESEGLPHREYVIYGDKKHTVGTLIVGFDYALRTLHKGDKAQFVIPHEYAFGNYDPVVYNVELLDVIYNDSTYEADLFDSFLEANSFTDDDTLKNCKGLYMKIVKLDTLDPTPVATNDTIYMKLTARYAEIYEGGAGRIFYPRPIESESEVFNGNYIYGGVKKYPITNAVDSAIKYMAEGQTAEIAFKSGAQAVAKYQWGYPKGVIDSDYNITIVPRYTPLHYTIEYIDNKNR